jgi:hypothetical protein
MERNQYEDVEYRTLQENSLLHQLLNRLWFRISASTASKADSLVFFYLLLAGVMDAVSNKEKFTAEGFVFNSCVGQQYADKAKECWQDVVKSLREHCTIDKQLDAHYLHEMLTKLHERMLVSIGKHVPDAFEEAKKLNPV